LAASSQNENALIAVQGSVVKAVKSESSLESTVYSSKLPLAVFLDSIYTADQAEY
jgi:hypothetical protein